MVCLRRRCGRAVSSRRLKNGHSFEASIFQNVSSIGESLNRKKKELGFFSQQRDIFFVPRMSTEMSDLPLGVAVHLPTVVGSRSFSSQRAAAILVFMETSYRVQTELVSSLVQATRRQDRSMLSDLMLRVADPDILRNLYENGFTEEIRRDILLNLNEMQSIASRNSRAVFEAVISTSIQNMVRAYEDLANAIV